MSFGDVRNVMVKVRFRTVVSLRIPTFGVGRAENVRFIEQTTEDDKLLRVETTERLSNRFDILMEDLA
jgi:hypothetical protein